MYLFSFHNAKSYLLSLFSFMIFNRISLLNLSDPLISNFVLLMEIICPFHLYFLFIFKGPPLSFPLSLSLSLSLFLCLSNFLSV